MFYYLLRRINLLFFTLFLISLLAFSLGYLFPGDPVTNFSGRYDFPGSLYFELTEKFKMEANYLEQYLAFIQRIFDADLGVSFTSQQPVMDELARVLPASIELSLYALLVAIVVGIPLGIWAGMRSQSATDYTIYSISVLGNAIPLFWLGLLFILIFALNLNLLPISGRLNLLYEVPHTTGFILIDIMLSDMKYKQQAFIDALRHLILPTLTLAMTPTTLLIAITRTSVSQVMQTNYIKAAMSKGLSFYQVMRKHVIRNALLPVIPQVGLLFNALMTSTMITEFIFSWPGVGHWLVEAIYQRDFPAIQAGLMVVSAFIILINILVDIAHTLLNPLVRKEIYATQ